MDKSPETQQVRHPIRRLTCYFFSRKSATLLSFANRVKEALSR